MSLEERLELTALICLKQPARGRRVAARWLQLYLEETPASVTIDDIALLASLLAALGGPRRDQALAALQDMSGRASSEDAGSGLRSA